MFVGIPRIGYFKMLACVEDTYLRPILVASCIFHFLALRYNQWMPISDRVYIADSIFIPRGYKYLLKHTALAENNNLLKHTALAKNNNLLKHTALAKNNNLLKHTVLAENNNLLKHTVLAENNNSPLT